ncbi:hypothetical protein [Agrobacterium sp. El2ro-1b]|uniref:hypothetical protein n=1 Tax=Agrobacterium sp. El2ro-1b TaxID=2969528 RepID=UPI003AAB9952
MAGASSAGIASCLVRTGILAEHPDAELDGIAAVYDLPQFPDGSVHTSGNKRPGPTGPQTTLRKHNLLQWKIYVDKITFYRHYIEICRSHRHIKSHMSTK